MQKANTQKFKDGFNSVLKKVGAFDLGGFLKILVVIPFLLVVYLCLLIWTGFQVGGRFYEFLDEIEK